MYQSCQPWYPQQATRARPVKARARRTAVLAVTHHLGTGQNLDQQLRQLQLQRMGEGEDRAVGELTGNGLVHVRVGVAEDDRAQTHGKVEEAVVVGILDLGPIAACQVVGTDRLRELVEALAESLGAAWNDLAGPGEQPLFTGELGCAGDWHVPTLPIPICRAIA